MIKIIVAAVLNTLALYILARLNPESAAVVGLAFCVIALFYIVRTRNDRRRRY